MKSITELRRIMEIGTGVISPSTALALLEDWEKMREALEFIQSENKRINEKCDGPSDMRYWRAQETQSRESAASCLASLKFKKGGV